MNRRSVVCMLGVAIVVLPRLAWSQAENQPPREFPAFRGTWILDENAGAGRIAGLPVARTLVIATTPTEISLVKDKAAARYLKSSARPARSGGSLHNELRILAARVFQPQ